MRPTELAQKYNKIAKIYQDELQYSQYGLRQLQRAMDYSGKAGKALDVGCGAGGRMVAAMQAAGYQVLGVDIAEAMIELACVSHADVTFEVADICVWHTEQRFNLIVGWDSLFHLPLTMHEPVISKLAKWLTPDGVLLYTFGDAVGEHTDSWHNDTFYYSSIGINRNLQLLLDCGLTVMHLELDQYPQRHVSVIARNRADNKTRNRIA